MYVVIESREDGMKMWERLELRGGGDGPGEIVKATKGQRKKKKANPGKVKRD